MASLLVLSVIAAPAVSAGGRPRADAGSGVVAVIGEAGLNPLHIDFRSSGGRRPSFPPGMPRPVEVPMPSAGGFDERLQVLLKGPLGKMQDGVLYYLSGTRLLFLATQDGLSAVGTSSASTVSVNLRELGEPHAGLAHGTGVVGAAVSGTSGTAPDALAVIVLGRLDRAYTWVSTQSWIDATSMSYGESRSDPCFAVAAVRAVHASGRIPFAAAGNTEVSAPVAVSAPNGMSEIYQVGGVDDTGRTWTPRVLPQDPYLGLIAPVRPYETGDDFFFDAPDYNSLDGRRTFGGTSGATPRTAGRAIGLIVAARGLLGDTDGGAEPEGRGRRGTRGPLSDGRLARDELVDLLHRTATPAEPAGPARHAVEGYGAVTDDSITLALRVLRGEAVLAPRPDEDASQRRIDDLRDRLYGPGSCP